MTCFVSPERVDCAVLSDSLSSSIVLMLLSSSISLATFVDPVSIEGSSIVRSKFSFVASEKSGQWTDATAAAYATLIRSFSGHDGA
jgi:hypothetical protein